MTSFLRWAVPLGIFGGSLLVSLSSGLTPSNPHRVAAVFPPWWSAQAVLEAASLAGNVVAAGGAPFVVAVSSERDDLADAIRAAGAIIVLDRSVDGLCVTNKD